MVNARRCADFQRFIGSSPGIGGGEFEGADDLRMTKHENVGSWSDLPTSHDFGFAEEISNEVDGMDIQTKEGVTLWVVAGEIMEVVIDKSLLCKPFPKDLYGRSISFL